jgi:hypothetical protein
VPGNVLHGRYMAEFAKRQTIIQQAVAAAAAIFFSVGIICSERIRSPTPPPRPSPTAPPDSLFRSGW